MSGTEDRRPSYFDDEAPTTTGFDNDPENGSDRSSFHVATSLSSVAVSIPVSEESKALADVKRCDVMAVFIQERVKRNNWLESYHEDLFYGTSNLGAFVRRFDGSYSSTAQQSKQTAHALEILKPQMAFTMSFTAVSIFLSTLDPDLHVTDLTPDFLLPVVSSIKDLEKIASDFDTDAGACVCRSEHFILVWASTPAELFDYANDIESMLVGKIWGAPTPRSTTPRTISSHRHTDSDTDSFPLRSSMAQKGKAVRSRSTEPKRRNSSMVNPHQRSSSLRSQSTESKHRTSPRHSKTHQRSVSFTSPWDTTGESLSSSMEPVPPLPVHFRQDSLRPDMMRRPTIGYTRALSQAELAGKPQSFPRLSILDSTMLQHAGITRLDASGKVEGTVSHATLMRMGVLEKALEIEEMGESKPEENVPIKDEEMQKNQKRPHLVTHACLVALAACLVVALELWCIADLIGGTRLDGRWDRWFLVLTIPMFALFSLFFLIVIAGCFFQLLVPVGCLNTNSVYYSAKAPVIEEHADVELPHITIEMPVYKEGLSGVVIPTVTSLLAAVRHYESYGGTATIYINDDGMQLVSPELQEARKTFYELNKIAWCSRPGQCTEPGEKFFLRKGKFKKASNMNYCLDFSLRVEAEFIRQRDERCAELGINHLMMPLEAEDEIYEQARDRVLELDGGRTWSGGDVRIGEYILIIDSDTIVPEDCLIAGALEMIESPEVGIIQHASGVMNVTGSLFENGITYFTNLIYTNIVHSVGSGDVGPFVGHNAFLRWRAIQSVSYQEDGHTKFWSECHVSEDFDVSLRLQMAGFIIRLAGYHNGGFKEGVSLTVYDELARWEKYAYGCNELVFYPFKDWWRHGPITPLFRRFLGSNIKITSKFTILAYIGTYYAIAAGLPLSVINYVLLGLGWQLDKFYQSSWHIWVGLAVIYNVVSPVCFAMLRYRTKQKSYLGALGECIKWLPLFLIFFSGLSFHLSKALLCHFFSINMEWTTTAKEVEKTGFRLSIIKVLKDFMWMYIVCLAIVAAMLFFAFCPWPAWRIVDFTVIIPLANQLFGHLFLPFFALGLL